MARLEEICSLITDGSHFSPEDEGVGYPMFSVKDMTPNGFNISGCKKIGEEAYKKLVANGCKPLNDDVVVAKDGSYLKTAFVIKGNPEIALLSSIAILRPKIDLVVPEYLSYFLKSDAVYRTVSLNYITGTALKRIILKGIRKIEVDLPDIGEQEQRAQRLSKVDYLCQLRKQQLDKLDELVKARFVEMFGDPVVNSKRWPVETIENHIDLLTGFPFDSSGYVSKGVNICGGLIIMPQKIDWSACKHWPQITGYEDYILRPNDIVIALDRPWISNGFKIAMVDREHLPALLIQRTARIRAVDINQHYLMQSLLFGRFDKHCNITGSLVPHISPKDIKSYSVMIPPIELQNQFATFAERVDQQKRTVQQSLEKLELMKKVLMQEYFG